MSSNYKRFVEILLEKADNWQNYCICTACRDTNGRSDALLKKFPFKTERVKNHLKKCQHFKNKHPELFVELLELETEGGESNELGERVVSSKRLRRESTSSAYSSLSWGSMCSFILFIVSNI